ncbi:uncharacterized protein N7511_003062 [Penicillium nucicola]|uniref:uncharacterized protein n=1 Tax=Penicillium nucicola TaxID=1850975 RepID=UPI0025453336|nr:uncharacterized protein N7511_003062 [Penicillium nucicola]KAJ5771011.1 hypothetical protein N7511_003062 [Penicillium nucicola]
MSPKHMYGLTAVPASSTKLLTNNKPPQAPIPIPVHKTPIPNTPLAQRINSYARHHLREETYNHSLRVYHYGLAIKAYRFPASQFPEWEFDDETYFLACVLHDIGTTRENLNATKLSFEFYGGMLALRVLQEVNVNPAHACTGAGAGAGNADKVEIGTGTGLGIGASNVGGPAATTTPTNSNSTAPRAQAESVAEAIIRHQDLCHVGCITVVGQLLQLATIFDNTGAYADLVHADTIKDVCAHFPRMRWSGCFAATVQEEIGLKPWAHSTALGEDFEEKVLGNQLMEPYE